MSLINFKTGLTDRQWEFVRALWKEMGRPSKRYPDRCVAFYTDKGRRNGVPAVALQVSRQQWELILNALAARNALWRGHSTAGEPIARFLFNPDELVKEQRPALVPRTKLRAVSERLYHQDLAWASAPPPETLQGCGTIQARVDQVFIVLGRLLVADEDIVGHDLEQIRCALQETFGWPQGTPRGYTMVLTAIHKANPEKLRWRTLIDRGPRYYRLTEDGRAHAAALEAQQQEETSP